MAQRSVLVVLDSVGIGALPDAAEYGDEGADTLGHVCASARPRLPNLARLGLGSIRPLDGVDVHSSPSASFGRMAQVAVGKDSTTGHWELAGLALETPFRTFPEGFPSALVKKLTQTTGCRFLGNAPASGTEILVRLGLEHQRTGDPILYTSADPVLQIAAHEQVLPVERLYELCRSAFRVAVSYGISRVIARPFVGVHPEYRRTERRIDLVVPPPAPTVLDALQGRGVKVVAIGKVGQLFAGRGISRAISTASNHEGLDYTLEVLRELRRGLVFTNLLDFDTLYGHRRDVLGYAQALEEFDARLPELIAALRQDDLLIVTADHGNDPAFQGTDHTREYVPLLVVAPCRSGGRNLGTRETFADVASTLAESFEVPWDGGGYSFLRNL